MKNSNEKKLTDLDFHTLLELIHKKEPSIQRLERKSLVFLRFSIISLARLSLIAENKYSNELIEMINALILDCSSITKKLDTVFEKNRNIRKEKG